MYTIITCANYKSWIIICQQVSILPFIYLHIFKRAANNMKSKAVVVTLIIVMATIYLTDVVFIGNKNGGTHSNKSAIQEMQKQDIFKIRSS